MSRSVRPADRRARIYVECLEARVVPAGLTSFVTSEHMHLNAGYDASAQTWSFTPHDSDNEIDYDLDDVAFYVATHQPQTQQAGYEFVGVGLGGSYYGLPSSPTGDLLTVSFTGLDVPPSVVDRYNPVTESKGRIDGSGRWLKISLIDVQHTTPDGQPGSGNVSVWFGGQASPTAFMSSFNDGIVNPNANGLDITDGITADDAVWTLAGGHNHFNWGFTEKGRYDITFRASGYFGDGGPGNASTIEGAYQQSQLFTVHFVVGSAGEIEFSSPTSTVNESAGTAAIEVRRVNGSDGQLTVHYATADGTAVAGADYTASSGTLTFADGETTKTITIPIVADSTSEANETIHLTLSDPGPFNLQYYLANVVDSDLLGATRTATLTIVDAAAPLPTISSVTPVIGPTTGGVLIAILGSGFTGVTSVTFGGVPGTNITPDALTPDAKLTVTSPLHTAGTVDIVVTTAAGSSASAGSGDNYTYAKPALADVVVNGGPNVTLAGTGSVVSLAGQHSVVKQILVTFNQAVTVATDAFTVTRRTANVTVHGGASPSSADATTSVTQLSPSEYLVTFKDDAGLSTRSGGILKSGVYDLTTIAAKITANGETMAANRIDPFFAMFGTVDSNNTYTPGAIGNGASKAYVDPGSLFAFSDAFGSNIAVAANPPYNVVFDANLDGAIDPGDLFAFSDAFGSDWTF